MDRSKVHNGALPGGRLLLIAAGLLFVPTAQGLDQGSFDAFCEVTLLCEDEDDGTPTSKEPPDPPAPIGPGGVLGKPISSPLVSKNTTNFGNSLSPSSNNTSSTLSNSSGTHSRNTIEDRLEVLRNDDEEDVEELTRPQESPIHLLDSLSPGDKRLQKGGGVRIDQSLEKAWGIFGDIKYSEGKRANITQDTGSVVTDLFLAGGVSELGFDYKNTNLTGGLDYKLSSNFILGLSGSYTKGDTDSQSSTSSSAFDQTSLSLFGSYYNDSGLFVDIILGTGLGETQYERAFSFISQIDGTTVEFSTTALSKTDTRLKSASLGTGFNSQKGAWTFSPFMQVHWVKHSIDSYRESPTIIANDAEETPENITLYQPFGEAIVDNFLLDVDGQNPGTLTSVIGMDIARTLNMRWGVAVPKISTSWVKQHKEGEDMIARFTSAVGIDGADFVTNTPRLDDSYFNISAGLTATLKNNLTSFIQIDTQSGNRDIRQTSINLGVRKEL